MEKPTDKFDKDVLNDLLTIPMMHYRVERFKDVHEKTYEDVRVRRVPGGWIFRFLHTNNGPMVRNDEEVLFDNCFVAEPPQPPTVHLAGPM